MDAIQVENLSFSYPNSEKPALDSLSFQIKKGEIVLLCGASGCGKTTLLRLLKPSVTPKGKKEGRASVFGSDVNEIADDSRIGFVGQDPEVQIVTDLVWHELAFGLENKGVPRESIERIVSETASYFGITPLFNRETASLSGGQKQILNLASVLCMDPDLILLDEPTANLDPISSTQFFQLIRRINDELGITVVLSEQRLEEAFRIADRVILLGNGRIIAFESPRSLGERLNEIKRSFPLYEGFPAAMRIFTETGGAGFCPVSVKEGIEYARSLVDGFSETLPEAKEPAEKAPAFLCAKELYFRYDKKAEDVLTGLSFELPQNQFSCLLGGNGSGKTTLLRVLSGVAKPYHGSVRFTVQKKESPAIAYLPQDVKSLFLKNSVREDLEFFLDCRGVDRTIAAEMIGETACRLHLSSLLERHPLDLSGGEMQRAALAKLLLTNPSALFLDEPTKGMDAAFKAEFGSLLKDLCARGATVLIATHDLDFAAEFSDRCGMLFDGKIQSFLPAKAFFAQNKFYTTAFCRIAASLGLDSLTMKEFIVRLKAQQSSERKKEDPEV